MNWACAFSVLELRQTSQPMGGLRPTGVGWPGRQAEAAECSDAEVIPEAPRDSRPKSVCVHPMPKCKGAVFTVLEEQHKDTALNLCRSYAQGLRRFLLSHCHGVRRPGAYERIFQSFRGRLCSKPAPNPPFGKEYEFDWSEAPALVCNVALA